MESNSFFQKYKSYPIAIYGLSALTERFISLEKKNLNIVGLLDGYRQDGELYGYPIISVEKAIKQNVRLIVIIARPGSCKAITSKIGNVCKDNNIALYDIRGKDMLAPKSVTFDFLKVNGKTKEELLDKIKNADAISFDLFDTLITRRVLYSTDIFELVEIKLKKMGIYIPDFSKLRLYSEKELSKNNSPTLTQIYEEVLKRAGGNFISAKELAKLEFDTDIDVLTPRREVCEIFRDLTAEKSAYIITNTYYEKAEIEFILSKFDLKGYKDLFISCEEGKLKENGLFEIYNEKIGDKKKLHIGDDEWADIAAATAHEIDAYHINSGISLFDALGGMGITPYIRNFSDKLKAGFFVSELFNSPFWFDTEDKKVSVSSCYDIGYLFCAPLIMDFILWLHNELKAKNIDQILFFSRDGYLIGRLFRKINSEVKSIYFLTSRAASVRVGMDNQKDIDSIDAMRYFGTDEENLSHRFGLKSQEGANRTELILNKTKEQRRNYKEYIKKFEIGNKDIAVFDFVAKGTSQMYLQKIFKQHLKGFYFLWLESDTMSKMGLDVNSFYSLEEKDQSAIFDNYYILETILTSPYPSTVEFDNQGMPVYMDETRSAKDIGCFEDMQKGIVEFFEEYGQILSIDEWEVNKKLDEALLLLLNKVKITNSDFLKMYVEDFFFGRMTAVKDIVG